MQEKRVRRAAQIESIFKVYNGSAVSYHAQKTSSQSVSDLCKNGSKVAKNTTIGKLIDEVRK